MRRSFERLLPLVLALLAATATAAEDPRLAAGRAKIDASDTDAGVVLLEKLVADSPGIADAWYWLGVGYRRRNAEDLEKRAFTQYLQLAPEGEHAAEARRGLQQIEQSAQNRQVEAKLRAVIATSKSLDAGWAAVLAKEKIAQTESEAYLCWYVLATPPFDLTVEADASRLVAREAALDLIARFHSTGPSLPRSWLEMYEHRLPGVRTHATPAPPAGLAKMDPDIQRIEKARYESDLALARGGLTEGLQWIDSAVALCDGTRLPAALEPCKNVRAQLVALVDVNHLPSTEVRLDLATLERLRKDVEKALASKDAGTAKDRVSQMEHIASLPLLQQEAIASQYRRWLEQNRARVTAP